MPLARAVRERVRHTLAPLNRRKVQIDNLFGRLAESEKRIRELTRLLDERTQRVERLQAQSSDLSRRLQESEARTADIVESLRSEAASDSLRLEWALARTEGLLPEIEAFEAERTTAAYRAAFDAVRPLVSVVIATMNRADLLTSRTIPSVLEQTYGNLEIVVVGDHCTDDTGERIAALGDARIRFENLAERGPYPPPGPDRWYVAGAHAMNKALSICRGDFITHLDDDDRMVPEKIATMLEVAQRDQADFLWHPFWHEYKPNTWRVLGNGALVCGQVTTGSIFYHRYFARFPWDVRAYRIQEPGDWNRIRKIKMLRPKLRFVPEVLMYHHSEHAQQAFEAQPGERFLT